MIKKEEKDLNYPSFDAESTERLFAGEILSSKGRKRVKTSDGEIELSTPRDHNGSFKPQFASVRVANGNVSAKSG